MSDPLIAKVLGDFTPLPGEKQKPIREGKPVTIWLPQDVKENYDRLQGMSGRALSKKIRQVLIAIIDEAGKRAG